MQSVDIKKNFQIRDEVSKSYFYVCVLRKAFNKQVLDKWCHSIVNKPDFGKNTWNYNPRDEQLFYSTKDKYHPISIVSFTLGHPRQFEYRRKGDQDTYEYYYNCWNQCDESQQRATRLGHGDVCVMGGYFENYYQHQVPPQENVSMNQARINLTYRWIRSDCIGTCKTARH